MGQQVQNIMLQVLYTLLLSARRSPMLFVWWYLSSPLSSVGFTLVRVLCHCWKLHHWLHTSYHRRAHCVVCCKVLTQPIFLLMQRAHQWSMNGAASMTHLQARCWRLWVAGPRPQHRHSHRHQCCGRRPAAHPGGPQGAQVHGLHRVGT